MTDLETISETHIRAGLSQLLRAATADSGFSRSKIARDAKIDRDALRRVLNGRRVISVSEALRILSASGASPHAHLLLYIAAGEERAADWMQSDLAIFFEEFVRHLPEALESQLSENLHDIKPRWARGTAQRVAKMLSDHIAELASKDEFLGMPIEVEQEKSHA